MFFFLLKNGAQYEYIQKKKNLVFMTHQIQSRDETISFEGL